MLLVHLVLLGKAGRLAVLEIVVRDPLGLDNVRRALLRGGGGGGRAALSTLVLHGGAPLVSTHMNIYYCKGLRTLAT